MWLTLHVLVPGCDEFHVCKKTIVFCLMNGGPVLEHVLLLPGIYSLEQSVHLITAPFPVVNISAFTFEDHLGDKVTEGCGVLSRSLAFGEEVKGLDAGGST